MCLTISLEPKSQSKVPRFGLCRGLHLHQLWPRHLGTVFSADDSERQLHIIYLANDILFDSLQCRINPHELDREGKCKVSDVETIQELIEKGNATRSAGTTGANEESSRSHASLQLAIQRSADGSESKPPRVVGKLSFIDLAGSE
ncbi:hypothetical protein CsSME_00046053 [Camellia sinensis var. sinensis]